MSPKHDIAGIMAFLALAALAPPRRPAAAPPILLLPPPARPGPAPVPPPKLDWSSFHADAAIAGRDEPPIHVLVQTKPDVRVLAASEDPMRLHAEVQSILDLRHDEGASGPFEWFIQSAPRLVA